MRVSSMIHCGVRRADRSISQQIYILFAIILTICLHHIQKVFSKNTKDPTQVNIYYTVCVQRKSNSPDMQFIPNAYNKSSFENIRTLVQLGTVCRFDLKTTLFGLGFANEEYTSTSTNRYICSNQT